MPVLLRGPRAEYLPHQTASMESVSEEQLIGLVVSPMEELHEALAEVLENVAIAVCRLLNP